MKSGQICKMGPSKDDDDEMLKSAGSVMETVRPAASHCKKEQANSSLLYAFTAIRQCYQ